MRAIKHTVAGLAVLVVVVTIPSLILAQAWIPGKNQGYASVQYQYVNVGDHLFSADLIEQGQNFGKSVDFGDIQANTILLSVDYGVIDRLALSGSIAYVSSKYDGLLPEDPALDDGSFHGSFQDISLAARYMLIDSPVVVTPLIGGVIPTHDYDVIGHTAVGTNQWEVNLGLSVGRILAPLSWSTYAQVTYIYSIVEEIGSVSNNRSNLNLDLGYFLTDSWTVSATANYQLTHDGLDWLEDVHGGNFHTHDQLAKADYFRLGGNVTYTVMRALNVSLFAAGTLWGENTHEASSLGLYTTWGFGNFPY